MVDDVRVVKRLPGHKAFEKEVEEAINGYMTANSGGLIGWTADVYNKVLHVECKYTAKPHIDLQSAWLSKNYDEAIREGRVPVLAIRITYDYDTYFTLVPNIEDRKQIEFFKSLRLTNQDLERLRIAGVQLVSDGVMVPYVVLSGYEIAEFAYECAKRMGVEL